MPEPPTVLSAEARAEWDRVTPELHRLGYVSRLDTAVLAAYCQSYGRFVTAERRLGRKLLAKSRLGADITHPLIAIARRSAADAVRYAAELGMTPTARVRLAGVEPLPPEDLSTKYF